MRIGKEHTKKEGKPSIMNVSRATYRDMIVARLEELKRLSSETSTPAKAYEQANEILFQTLLSVAGYIGKMRSVIHLKKLLTPICKSLSSRGLTSTHSMEMTPLIHR